MGNHGAVLVFLVTTQHRLPEIRKAGFLYLVMAHLGAIAILLSFGILQGGSWHFTFDAMRAAHLGTNGAAVAFCLALIGFGAKAGLVPLHVWLPEAHPAAPSPVSALMSGVMLEVALYGMIRVSFDLLGLPLWWWGLLPLALGLFSALYGVVFAAVQTDMKRLLAYSSIENIGIMFTGLGLAIVFAGVGMRSIAALTLIAVMYHAMNHAVMKSLLFLGTGAVLHATGERNLGHLGGLIHRMPWVAWLTLIGVLAIAGLPPLNGFVSEWLLLQSFLLAYQVPHPFINMLLPLGAALLALAAALAAYVMVKFYGVIFLGQPREQTLQAAHDAGFAERLGLALLASGCILLGFFPSFVISQFERGHPRTRPGRIAGEPCSVVAAAADSRATVLVRAAGVLCRDSGGGGPVDFQCPAVLSPTCPQKRRLGLRIRPHQQPHAGHRRGIRAADPASVSAALHRRAAAAAAVRYRTHLSLGDRRSNLARAVRTAGTAGAAGGRQSRLAATGPHCHLSAVQLRHSRGPSGADAMNPFDWTVQLLGILLAIAAAPVLLGWVNMCRAWLQNKSAPSILQPYRGIRKLFNKDAVLAQNASRLFRLAPYVVFGAMVMAAAVIPSIATRLPITRAADAIALVGLLATARVFLSLAAMDVGTAFGTLGARREMMIGFLAEPALLVVIFVVSLTCATKELDRMLSN